jgi:hypothetical protein
MRVISMTCRRVEREGGCRYPVCGMGVAWRGSGFWFVLRREIHTFMGFDSLQ